MCDWKDILDDLVKYIASEETSARVKLPSENDLVMKYGVKRHEARKVFERLSDMGYVYSVKGKGRYYKSKHDKIELLLTGDESFTEKMKKKGHKLITKNLEFEEMPLTESLRKKLKLSGNNRIYKISRLRIIDGEPAALHISYVADKLFKDIKKDGPFIQSMFSYYRAHGYEGYYSQNSDLQALLPTSSERHLLACPSLVPIMILESQCFAKKDHEVLEATKIIYRGDRFICRLRSKEA